MLCLLWSHLVVGQLHRGVAHESLRRVTHVTRLTNSALCATMGFSKRLLRRWSGLLRGRVYDELADILIHLNHLRWEATLAQTPSEIELRTTRMFTLSRLIRFRHVMLCWVTANVKKLFCCR